MSLSALSITGKICDLRDKFTPRLTTRKTYNAEYFFDDKYHHEIANHYRDYKQRPSIRRRRYRNIYERYRRKPIFVEKHEEQRSVLPVTIQSFPRFGAVYTPRGRRTLCESEPPDESYNHTLRRIRNASSCGELKALAERQFAVRENVKRRTTLQGPRGTYNENPLKLSCGNATRQSTLQTAERSRQCEQQRHNRCGNPENALSRPGVVGDGSSRKPHTDKAKSNNEYYLQLASEYYKRTFLSNLKYLKSIAERNAYRRQCRNQQAGAATKVGTSSDSCRTASAVSNDSSSTSVDCLQSPRITVGRRFGLTELVKSVARRRTFRIGVRGTTSAPTSPRHDTNADWAIRVNITPVATGRATRPTKWPISASIAAQSSQRHGGDCSMNDYLNANVQNSLISNTSNGKVLISRATTATQQQSHFHDIIDQLMQLEINQTDSSSLPKITLTDCSTSSTANSSAKTSAACSQSETDAEILRSSPPTGGAFILQQAKLNRLHSSLDIPDEPCNYHSESRPP